MTNYSQRYASGDSNTAGAFQFDLDTAGTTDVPVTKIMFGANNADPTRVTSSVGLPVGDAGGSLTVDAPVGTPVFVRLSDGSAAITTLAVSLASVPSHAVTNAGTFAVQIDAGAVTSLALLDDAIVADDAAFTPATTKVMMAGFEFDDTTPDSVDEGDGGAARMSANRCQYVVIRDNAGNERGLNVDASGNITVNVTGTVTVGSHAVTNAGTFAVQAACTNAGTFVVQENGSALTALQLIDDAIYAEDVASQAADKGIAILAVRQDATGTMVGTSGDYANLQVDANGLLKVNIIAGAGSGGTAMTDDAAFTVATTSITPVGGTYKSTLDAVDDGDGGAFAMTAKRALHSFLVDVNGDAVSVGGGTQYTEDAAAAANPVGNMLIVVREDGRAGSLTSTDGDNVALRGNNLGELYVKHTDALTVNSHAVTNAGTFAVQAACTNAGTFAVQAVCTNAGTFAVQAACTIGAAATSIGKAEDVASADADVGVPAMAIRKGTPANTSGTDGDYEMLQMSAGRLWVDPSGVTLTVASHAVTNAGTFVTQIDGAALTALQLIDDAVSGTGFNVSQLNGVAVTMGNGASGTGVQRVTIANDSTGILAGVTTVTTVTTCSTVSTLTGSAIAHDSADSGNPHKIGAKASTALSGVTLVADADRTDARSSVDGAIFVRDICLEDVVQERTTNTDGASTAFASGLGAPGAGVRLWVTKVTIANSSASFCTVDLRDGAAGSVLWTLPVPATGGVVERFDPPLKLTANTALAFDASAATSTLSISANGFKSKI